MEDVKIKLIEFFKTKNKYYTLKELRDYFNIHGEEQVNFFDNLIKSLEEEGYIYYDSKKGYTIFENNKMGLAYGTLEINKSGNGFVHTKEGYTIFIENDLLNGALNNDKVIVNNITPSRNSYKGSIYKIVKRSNSHAYFIVVGNGLNASFIPYNNNYNIPIELNKTQRKNLLDGQIIEVSLPLEEEYGVYPATLENVVGHESDPTTDIKVIASELNIETIFHEDELEEAKHLPAEVSKEEIQDRVDLRDKEFITIDCDNTKDRDDAVYLEKLENGNYKLYVSIASVNHYIKKGSALYDGILRRCTSHYPNNMCIPMLPHTISNGICSLNEGVDRLTKTCEMEIDNTGNVVNYKIYNSVINSKKAMKYSLVNELLDGKEIKEYSPFKTMLTNMQELSEILNEASKKRKYLNFNVPEIEVKKENGINQFYINEQGKAEKLIENFMVITDNTVAKEYGWLPFIFRTHEYPNEDLVKQVIEKIKCAGIHINIQEGIDAATIKKILSIIDSQDEYHIFNEILLRSMKKAKYSTNNYGHFALQLDDYCHFTSPIRRVADFMVHTIIDEAEKNNYDPDFLRSLETDLIKISQAASKEEIVDKKFEDEARRMAMAEYMEDHLQEDYRAVITEVYPHGVFVRTDALIDGKVSLDNIITQKGKCRYNPDMDAIVVVGENTVYHIGDEVDVKSIDASKENRTVNFELVRKRKMNKN